MRKNFSSSDVEHLLNDNVKSIEALTSKLSMLSSDQTFSDKDAFKIIQKCNALKTGDNSEEYEFAVGKLLERCSYNSFKLVADRIDGGMKEGSIRKHLHIILANKEITENLFSNDLYKELKILEPPIPDADRSAILPVFMQAACKYTNMEQLEFIYTNYRKDFDDISQQKTFSEYRSLLSAAVESKFDRKFNLDKEYRQFGSMNFDGMLTLCAALHESKPYFNPVVLNCDTDSKQLQTLLKFVSDNLEHFNNGDPVVFIAKSTHTISGAIQIIEGVAHLTFIDSLGEENFNNEMIWYDGMRPKNIIGFAEDTFGKEKVKANVLIDEQRQKSGLGCTAFSIKDAMVISRYPSILLEKLGSNKLWILLKSAQTSKVPEKLQKERPNEFMTVPINNKIGIEIDKRTYQAFLPQYFRDNPETGKKQNYYMHDKLGKWRDKVINFLKKHDKEDPENSRFTLEGFCKKVHKEMLNTKPPTRRLAE